MTIKKRKSNDEKAKIALEALKEEKPLAMIAVKYGVHPNQITRWKKQLIQHAGDAFNQNGNTKEKELKDYQDDLYKEIGKLRAENEFLKKKLDQDIFQ